MTHRRQRIGVALLVAASVVSCAGADVTLVEKGADWNYLDDGSDQGTAYTEFLYDDDFWGLPGPAELGYGDGDEATVVSFGPNAQAKYITTYFRHEFEVADLSELLGLTLRILRDDGAIVSLNEQEVYRTNMPSSGVNYLTVASTTQGGTEEHVFHETLVDLAELQLGTNLLAVEIHQRSGTSSDISFDLELIADDGNPDVIRGPYMQQATSSGAHILWRTSLLTSSTVMYGTAPDMLTETATTPGMTTKHDVAITGLAPSTTYFYAILHDGAPLVGGDADHRFTTAPMIGTNPPIRIWAIGDSGTANANAAAVFTAYQNYTGAQPTDVWLMLGDNAYETGTDDEYQAAVFDMYTPLLRQTSVWPTLGNHDAGSADSPSESGVYYDVFTLPDAAQAGGLASGTEAYYSFDYGNVHFVCLDSHDTPRGTADPMLTWLAADLANTLADWVIAYWHHPPYTKGSHDSDNVGDSGGRMRDMRENALPILEAAGVDLVLCGHSHSYERSYLLDGHHDVSATFDPLTMAIDGGDGRVNGNGQYAKPTAGIAAHEGAVYIVAGSSGKISGGPLDHPAIFVSLNQLGSVVLDVDGLRLDASFLRSTGAVTDSFTIIKGCPNDVDADGIVGFVDVLEMLSSWGPCAGCRADLDDSGDVDFGDLLQVLSSWGPCP